MLNIANNKNKKIKIGAGVVAIIIGIYALSGIYRVPKDNKAIISTFGKITKMNSQGTYWRAQGIQDITLFNTSKDYDFNLSSISTLSGDFLNTYSASIVYNIEDPYKYLTYSNHGFNIIKSIAYSYIDSELNTSSKEVITGSQVVKMLNKDQVLQNMGVKISSINISETNSKSIIETKDFKSIKEDLIKEANQTKSASIAKANNFANSMLTYSIKEADLINYKTSYIVSEINSLKDSSKLQNFNSILNIYKNNNLNSILLNIDLKSLEKLKALENSKTQQEEINSKSPLPNPSSDNNDIIIQTNKIDLQGKNNISGYIGSQITNSGKF